MPMTNEQIMDHMSQLIRVGFVTARQPEKHRVQVELRDTVTSPLVTKWLPVLCPCVSGDLHYDLPDIGDQVLCLFLSYGLEQGFVVGSMYGKQTPPVSDAEKFHRKFKDGATIEYDRATHALTANIPGTAKIVCTGTLTLDAPHILLHGALTNTAQDGGPGKATFSGGVEILNGGLNAVSGDVVASGVSLAGHTTTGVQSGAGTSGIPTGGASGLPTAAMAVTAATIHQNYEQTRNDVYENGTDKEKLLLCLPNIAAAEAEEQGSVNDRQGWLYLHDMFEQWFGGPVNEDALNNPKAFWVDMDWVLSYDRAATAHRELCSSSYLFSPNAQQQLASILQRDCKLLPDARADFDYTAEDWTHWQAGYFQRISVERDYSQSTDGLMAAMGAFSLRALAKGYTEPMAGGHKITVQGVSIIVWDTFNFENQPGKDEFLGIWNCSPPNFGRGTRVYNSDFIEFRKKYGRGNDFLVISTPKPIDIAAGFSYETGL